MKHCSIAFIGLFALLNAVATQNCSPSDNNQFECDNGNCIPKRDACDGRNDCGDNSDEPEDISLCPPCNDDEFRCTGTGRCIRKKFVCDGEPDCADNSDEPSDSTLCPPCDDDQFRCRSSRRCIPITLVCNGDNDCGDNSDEPQDTTLCPPKY